jgi:DNA invertase Pin-like site-specific DNA recombinase
MKKDTKNIIYGVYYRKSSEAADRQAYSIPDQIRDTDMVIKRENLTIGKKFPGESQTAFKIGRPIFADLVKSIENGKINAILVWHPNRLARNPRDGGMLLWLIDEGKLKEIRTPSRVYYNTASDKFMLQLEFGMSKKDSDDKSEVVKRALEGRAKRGLPNGVAHIGYINDQSKEKGNRGWLKDPIRYPLVKKIINRMLTGKYSVRDLYEYAKDELKLTTPKRKNLGGKPIAISYMYTLLKDPIHAGFFLQKSNEEVIEYQFTGFEPMITKEEYWKIQDLLGRKGMPRTTKRKAVYNHFTKCGTCGGNLSTDFKFQVICSSCKKKFSYINCDTCPSCNLAIDKMVNPTFLKYVFYYCLNNKRHKTCPNNGIEEKSLETQLVADIEQNLAISKELSMWCIDNIGKLKDKALNDAINIQKNLEQEKIAIENKIKRLTLHRISRDFSLEENSELDNIQKELRNELSLLELKASNTNIDWLDEAKKDFNLLNEIILIIKTGTIEQKKTFFMHLVRT